MAESRITGKSLQQMWGVEANHALYREDGKWYHHLTKFPGVLFDAHGYIVFKNSDEYENCPYLQLQQDLHIPEGIASIPGYIRLTEHTEIEEVAHAIESMRSEPKLKQVLIQTARIVRDSVLAQQVKSLYGHKCQICGIAVEIRGTNKLYAEGHHIIPLGAPHYGPDVLENILCVCPNHHVQLDYGAIQLNLHQLIVHPCHSVNPNYIHYHNDRIWMSR